MGWREAWALSEAPFRELAFQATYALRAGNLPLRLPEDDLGGRALRQVRLSKLLVSLVIGATIVGGLYAIASPQVFVGPTDLPRPLYDAAIVSGLYLLEFSLLWWTSLQALPVLLSSRTLVLLETLPLAPRTRERTALVVFWRLFDLPVLSSLVLTPIAVAVALGSPWAGLATLPGSIVTVVFALSLGLATARYFVRRVHGSHGGARATIARWLLLALWTLPALALYGLLTLTGPLLGGIDALLHSPARAAVDALILLWPMPLGLAPTVAGTVAAGAAGDLGLPYVALAGSLGYGALAALTLRWLARAPRRLVLTAPETDAPGETPRTLRVLPVAGAVVTKDLRSASRVPGFAFLVLLPIFESVALGMWTLLQAPTAGQVSGIVLAAIASSAFVATFFGPAFFALEVQGFSYTRSLPVTARNLLAGKVALIAALYLLSGAIALGLADLRHGLPAAYGLPLLAALPGVVAAAVVELGLLLRLARRRGVPVVNLYTGAWWALLVEIPGLFVAMAPLVLFELLRIGGSSVALPAMAALGLGELAVALPVGWIRHGGV